jgi:excinuclease ABC subunit A
VDYDYIYIKGAKVHNLKNISLKLPKNSLIVFSGVSGSGKSSLAFDTIYAEGQRRYIESLSSYARQFLGQIEKPDVDSIIGIMPAISMDQKTTSYNPRSTVGTTTEIYDYLRLLYSKVGVPYCSVCNNKLKKTNIIEIYNEFISKYNDELVTILAPISKGRKGGFEDQINNIKSYGFNKLRINNTIYDLDNLPNINKNNNNKIEIVIDRIKISNTKKSRIYDSIEQGFKYGEGIIYIEIFDKIIKYSLELACTDCMIFMDKLEPRSFSFNSPYGACQQCDGLGSKYKVDKSSIIFDKNLSVLQGAIGPWSDKRFHKILNIVFDKHNIDINLPYSKLPKKIKDILLFGDKKIIIDSKFEFANKNKIYSYPFEGIIKYLERKFNSDNFDPNIKDFFYKATCTTCNGSRLNIEALSVKINDKNISEITSLSVLSLQDFIENIQINDTDLLVAQSIIREVSSRLQFLSKVGLDYLTLDRSTNSLSGGESQRIRLASQIGSGLSGVLYVLDEPSIGLHPIDNAKLISTLNELKNIGNTLIVVEHDEEMIINSDYLVDLGPEAGFEGGNIVYQGEPKKILHVNTSITGRYLAKINKIPTPNIRRKPLNFISIIGAQENNLKNISTKIPLGVITAVTGVSGSGKSTFVLDILANFLLKKINKKTTKIGKHKKIQGYDLIDKVVIVDQSPIGRTPRSNPATYTGLFQPIRELFASTKEAKIKGYNPGRFSFNVKTGRCLNCSGDGYITIIMNFLPDVQIVCEICSGKRYNEETLEIYYKGKNISDILNLTVDQALLFFKDVNYIYKYLKVLSEVGLGYIKLGQSATTLSGGEAQRVKLASELHKKNTGNTLYIFDEPSTGLHFQDVDKLVKIFHKLADLGNTILVIEHNLDIIRISDYIIDLGPGGGPNGGNILFAGTPEEIIKNKKSVTGKFLKKEFIKNK